MKSAITPGIKATFEFDDRETRCVFLCRLLIESNRTAGNRVAKGINQTINHEL
jgi:hypothetical protein